LENQEMQAVFRLLLLQVLAVVAMAQSDRQSIEHYEANFEKYLGADITLMVDDVDRRDTGEHGDVAVFYATTRGQRDVGFVLVAVPRTEVDAFVRRYSVRGYGQTRPMRGTFKSRTNGTFYISFRGAKYPEEAASIPERSVARGSEERESPLPAFDKSPITSFSYDGKRLIEARIIEISADSVRLADKHDVAVVVPLERAVKMPDLRMKAKDAMEAAIKAGHASP